jgi:hypothetical protein
MPRQLPDVSEEIRGFFQDEARKRQGGSPSQNFRASSIGDPCPAYLYHTIASSEYAKPIDAALIGIFGIGDALEPKAIEYLKKIGFKGRQPDNRYWRDKRISGRLDLIAQRDDVGKDWFPVEIKWLGSYGDKYVTWKDMLNSDKRWSQRYPGQLVAYQLLYDAPVGLFIIFDKMTADPSHIWFELDEDVELLEYAESLLKKIEYVQVCLEKKTPAERIRPEAGLCIDCEFLMVCMPPMWFGKEAVMLPEGKISKLLDEREQVQPNHSRYEAIDRELKKLLGDDNSKAGFLENAVAGDWIINSKMIQVKGEEKPREAHSYWRRSYKKIGLSKEQKFNDDF